MEIFLTVLLWYGIITGVCVVLLLGIVVYDYIKYGGFPVEPGEPEEPIDISKESI
jgi:hypothetical protein